MHLFLHGLLGNVILRSWRREPLRALATLFGVALGLAVIVAIELSKRSSIDSFKDSLDEMSGKAALEIRGPNGVPEQLLTTLYDLRDYGKLSPVVETDAYATDWKQQLRVLGVDMLRDQEVREYQLIEFGQNRSQPTPTEFLNLLSESDSVIISQKLAKRKNLHVGSQFTAVFGDKPVTLTVRGILLPQGIARALEGNVLIMDLAAAQWHSGKLGRLDRLEMTLPSTLDMAGLDALEENIRQKLPAGLSVGRPGRRGGEVEKMLAAYHFNLTLLGAIAFLAGLCVLYNSISLSVIGRRAEVGMLRTLGTSRGSILRLFLAESLVFGLIGGVLGLVLGKILANGAMQLQETTNQTLYGQFGTSEATVSPAFLAGVAVLGVLMALVAAWWPAREASKISPISALMPTQHLAENRAKRRILGATLAITAIAACWLPPLGTGNERGLPWGGVYACFGAVVAMGLLLPDFLQAILRWARPFARNQRGPAWQLALGGLAAGRQRLGVPLAALAGTLALSAAIAIMVDSFRTTLNYWISTTLAADIYLRPASKVSGSTESYISAEVVSELANHADVASMEELRLMDVPFRGSKILLSVSNFASMATRGTLAMRGMQSPKELLANASGSSRVFVSEAFARRFNHNEGDEFLLPTGNGDQTITIAGVFYDYSNDRGTVMLDRTFFEQTYGPFHATNVAAYVKPGVDASTTVEQLRQGIGTLKAVEIFSNAGLRQEILRIFDKTFAITWTLEIIALLVAMASVATTIFTLILERKEELRTLSQLGTSAKQLRRAFGIEGFLLGIVSQVGGLILGLLLSLVLIYVINVQSFGWTIRFHPPWAMLLGSAVLAPLATALAAMLASRAMFTLGLMK